MVRPKKFVSGNMAKNGVGMSDFFSLTMVLTNSYYDRLSKLGLTTLETRRLRGDIIEVFKIFKGFENVSYNTYFTFSQSGLRGHSFKLYKPNCARQHIC